uniref:RING-type domain-containing protein n=1 Tax=Loa loa TaxID=7209 RepID=A0A1I7W5I3_LOALO
MADGNNYRAGDSGQQNDSDDTTRNDEDSSASGQSSINNIATNDDINLNCNALPLPHNDINTLIRNIIEKMNDNSSFNQNDDCSQSDYPQSIMNARYSDNSTITSVETLSWDEIEKKNDTYLLLRRLGTKFNAVRERSKSCSIFQRNRPYPVYNRPTTSSKNLFRFQLLRNQLVCLKKLMKLKHISGLRTEHPASSEESTNSENSTNSEKSSISSESSTSLIEPSDSNNLANLEPLEEHPENPSNLGNPLEHSVSAEYSTNSKHSSSSEYSTGPEHLANQENSSSSENSTNSEYLTGLEHLPSQENPSSSHHMLGSEYSTELKHPQNPKCSMHSVRLISSIIPESSGPSRNFETSEILRNLNSQEFSTSFEEEEEGRRILIGPIDPMLPISLDDSKEASTETSNNDGDSSETDDIYPFLTTSTTDANVIEETPEISSQQSLNMIPYEILANPENDQQTIMRGNPLIINDESYVEYFICSQYSSSSSRNSEQPLDEENLLAETEPENQQPSVQHLDNQDNAIYNINGL